jgi:hypothetical protein
MDDPTLATSQNWKKQKIKQKNIEQSNLELHPLWLWIADKNERLRVILKYFFCSL